MNLKIPLAFSQLLDTQARYKVFYGGRGSAKSESFARAQLIQGMQARKLFLNTRELQVSIQDSVHRLLASTIMNENLADQYEVLQSTIRHRYNGTEFIFKGLKHNITEIKGLQGVDCCWVEEAENVSDRSWETLIPTIRKENSEIWVSFNPKNLTDPTYQRFVVNPPPDSIVKKVSYRDNPFFPRVLRKEMQTLKDKDPDAYSHIWEGELDIRKSGAVYARLIDKARSDGRITSVPYDPAYEVFTAWDLGWGDSTAIWFLQFAGRELRWIDCYENSGEGLDHYAQLIKSKPYNYMKDGHFLPHDGGSGNIRGDSVSKQLASMGLQNQVLTRENDINPGIELVRQTIQYSVFDSKLDGLKALEAYAYEWDDDRQTFKPKPRHDWSSNYADAARYAARAAQMIKGKISVRPRQVEYVAPSYSEGWMG